MTAAEEPMGPPKPTRPKPRPEPNELSLHPEKVLLLRTIKHNAVILLLLAQVQQSMGEVDIAAVLDLHPQTVRHQLNTLESLGLVRRDRRYHGYWLTRKGWTIFRARARKNRAPDPINIITVNTENQDRETDKNSAGRAQPSEDMSLAERSPEDLRLIWEALKKVGIYPNPRTERLARQAHITPGYIQAHYQQLDAAKRGDQTGLLVVILESGAPAPELNCNGHLKGCACLKCAHLKFAACPYCNQDPCVCAS